MNRVVVDSNILVKWFIPEKYSDEACVLRNDVVYGRIKAVVPIYALLEFCNTIRKYVLLKILDGVTAQKIYDLLMSIDLELVSIDRDLVKDALRYSLEKHVTVYDAYYVVLAYKYDCTMYTADEKLLNKLSNVEKRVKHIRDYPRDRVEILQL